MTGKKILDELLLLFNSGKIVEGIEQAKFALITAKISEYYTYKIYNYLGVLYRLSGQFELSLAAFEKSIQLAAKNNDTKQISDIHVNLSSLYAAKKDFSKAINHAIQAVKSKEIINEVQGLIPAYLQLAVMNNKIHYEYYAIQNLNKAKELMFRHRNFLFLYNYYFELGVMHFAKKEYQLALTAYKKSIQKKQNDFLKNSLYAKLMIASCYIKLKNYKKAESIVEQCILDMKDISIPRIYMISLLQKFTILIHLNDTEDIEHIIAKINTEDVEDLEILSDYYYNTLRIYYMRKGNYKLANEAAEKMLEINNKMYDENIQSQALALQSNYEIEKKENELKSLKIKEIESELKILRSQLNSHFIFNAINTFRKEMLKGNIKQADLFLLRFSKLLRMILDGSRHEALSLKDNIELIENYILLEQSRQNFSFDYKINVAKNLADLHIFFPTNILQPIIENAIAHGLFHLTDKKGKLSVTFSITKNKLKAVIDDNGVGRNYNANQKNNHVSHAIKMVEETINMLNQKFAETGSIIIKDKFRNNKPSGTQITIEIPFQ